MDPEETGEEIAEEIGEAVESALAEPIAAAVEAQAQAEETAEQIAAAAMESARMQRIEIVERDLAECRSTLEQLPLMLAEQFNLTLAPMQAQLTALEARLSAGEAAPPVLVLPSDPNPASELTPPTLTKEIIPADLTPPPSEAVAVPPARKRNRFL